MEKQPGFWIKKPPHVCNRLRLITLNKWIISERVELKISLSLLFMHNNHIFKPQTHADNAQTINSFCMGDLPMQKQQAFQAKSLIVSRSD